jgi:AraC family transcriptional regulator, regulatory protein of adaptative response / methylated-DNA-[protein]-cysteine methyltransferase
VTSAAYDAGYESLSGFYQAFQQIIGNAPRRSDSTRTVYLHWIGTPLGSMLAAATETSLCLLEFTDRRMLETQLRRVRNILKCNFLPVANDVLLETESQMQRYFEGTLATFRVPLEMVGSEFQQAAWTALLQIPPGETRSYAEQAKRIGRPSAVRAVARANGDNRIAIIIPCHRVVGSDGRLTGYGGGLWRKKYLIEHEQRYAQTFALTTQPG